MNTRQLLLLLATVVCQTAANAEQAMVGFNAAPVPAVLAVYKGLTHLELVESSDVTKSAAKITIAPGLIDRADAIKTIEKALAEQAGIVVTKLDDQHASVAYNDALLKKPEAPRSSRLPQPLIAPQTHSSLLLHTDEVLRIELTNGDIATIRFLSLPTRRVVGGPGTDEARYRWELIRNNSKSVGTNSTVTTSPITVGDLSFRWSHILDSVYIHADLLIGKFQKLKATDSTREGP